MRSTNFAQISLREGDRRFGINEDEIMKPDLLTKYCKRNFENLLHWASAKRKGSPITLFHHMIIDKAGVAHSNVRQLVGFKGVKRKTNGEKEYGIEITHCQWTR